MIKIVLTAQMNLTQTNLWNIAYCRYMYPFALNTVRSNAVQLAVAHRAGVVVHLKVWLIFRSLARFWLAKVLALALMVLVQLGKEGLVRSLREHALLL